MALHRDIYWVGRQWAVTGFGIQAIDQRLQGTFDIECPQVWDEGLQERRRAHAWVNKEDFDKAVIVARQRFPRPAAQPLPLVESVLELIQQPAQSTIPQPMLSSPDDPGTQRVKIAASEQTQSPPRQLRMQGQLARFLPQWRVRR
jgi:hypothetical protein